jgi:hypothetical protein
MLLIFCFKLPWYSFVRLFRVTIDSDLTKIDDENDKVSC